MTSQPNVDGFSNITTEPATVSRRNLLKSATLGAGVVCASNIMTNDAKAQTHVSDPARMQRLLPGFKERRITTSGAEISVMMKGDGPPLLLLHGHPQTLICWHKIAPRLAEHYTVVLTDLRGYGDSSKPDGGPDQIAYSKREMAKDQVEVMKSLGFDSFFAAGHDRGGRVLHRLLLDHPTVVRKAAILDIAPTSTMYAKVDKTFATKYMWWFFLIQPAPLPETLIGNNLEYYIDTHIGKQNKTPGAIDADAMAEYKRCYTKETLHAVCEDYRAAAGIDLVHDESDKHKKISAPLLALWGAKGVVGATYDVIATWKEKALDVQGEALPCGHYLPEERPDLVLRHFENFFV